MSIQYTIFICRIHNPHGLQTMWESLTLLSMLYSFMYDIHVQGLIHAALTDTDTVASVDLHVNDRDANMHVYKDSSCIFIKTLLLSIVCILENQLDIIRFFRCSTRSVLHLDYQCFPFVCLWVCWFVNGF